MKLKEFLEGFEDMDPEAKVYVLHNSAPYWSSEPNMVRGDVTGLRFNPEEGVLIYFDQER